MSDVIIILLIGGLGSYFFISLIDKNNYDDWDL